MNSRSSVVLKFFATLTLAALTWFVTSSIMNRSRSVNADDRVANPVPFKVAQTAENPVFVGRMAPMKTIPGATLAGGSLTRNEMTVDGESVDISVGASLFEKKSSGHQFLWRVRTFSDPSLQVIQDHFYEDQMFSFDPSGKMEITFKERIALPPGRYLVSVLLYRVPVGTDLAVLQDDQQARAMQDLGASRRVVIAAPNP